MNYKYQKVQFCTCCLIFLMKDYLLVMDFSLFIYQLRYSRSNHWLWYDIPQLQYQMYTALLTNTRTYTRSKLNAHDLDLLPHLVISAIHWQAVRTCLKLFFNYGFGLRARIQLYFNFFSTFVALDIQRFFNFQMFKDHAYFKFFLQRESF